MRLLLLGLVAMLKAAMRARRRSGSKKMTEVVQEGGDGCNGNGIDCKREMSRSRK